MAWSGSDRASRLPSNWATLRMRVLRRDAYKCQDRDSMGRPCGEPANEVDHVIPGDDHSLENLRAICRWHHARKSSAEGRAAQAPRPSRRRKPEAHPGLIPKSSD
jgi:5-methylcytosine-specific restriction enzyme A